MIVANGWRLAMSGDPRDDFETLARRYWAAWGDALRAAVPAGTTTGVPGAASWMPPGMAPGMPPGMPPGMAPGMPPGMPPGMSAGALPGMQAWQERFGNTKA